MSQTTTLTQKMIYNSKSLLGKLKKLFFPNKHGILNDPFQTGRNASRLIFDFSVATSLLRFDNPNKKILDFACGTGWTSEFLNKLGFDVYGFDIDKEVIKLAGNRYRHDQRIKPQYIHFSFGDGHKLTFQSNSFGHIFCFDSLHHMKSYPKVLKEMYRVLDSGGIAVFVEPGSTHADSKETKQYLRDHPRGKYWIEKSVDLQNIYNLSKSIGFVNMTIKPHIDPSLESFSFIDWYNITDNPIGIQNHITELRRFNYENRIIFSLSKPKT